jgi:hypothetical protein
MWEALILSFLSGDRNSASVHSRRLPPSTQIGLLFNTHLLKRDHGVAYLFRRENPDPTTPD